MSQEIIPADSVVEVAFAIKIPAGASKQDIQEWVNLHMGCGSMSVKNPLSNYEPEALDEPVLTDTKKRLIEKHIPKTNYTEVTRTLKPRN